MKCPVHSDRNVVGYCIECGAFGCDLCLSSGVKGDNICKKCEKAKSRGTPKDTKQGLVSKLFGDKRTPTPEPRPVTSYASVSRKATAGRKLLVRFRNNRSVKGTTYKLDINSSGFYLVPLEPVEGQERIFIYFSDIKAIHFIRDFEGKGSPEPVGAHVAEGQEIKVVFQDGEIIEGHTLHHFDPSCQRFYIVPREDAGNTISILVERSALKGIETEAFKQGVFAEEEEVGLFKPEKQERAPLSQSESMGDLYFSMKNYDSALIEYEKVKKDYPNDKRLNLKISVCNFNRGVNFIKSRKYLEAKAEFEKIGEDDPIYDKAKKKIKKIEKILKEAQSMGA
ncbi:MAG: hypothetical protein Kow0099_00570 [Candidatus Abyssubacteria bacterium]